MKPQLEEKTIREILRLRSEGESFRKIGAALGITGETCRRYWNRHASDKSKPLTEFTDEPVSQDDVGVLKDTRDLDGEVSIVTKNEPITREELRALLGDDTGEWVETHFTANSYQSPMKIRTTVGNVTAEKPTVITLWQTKVAFRRVIADELRLAIDRWTEANVQPVTLQLPHQPIRNVPKQVLCVGLYDFHLGMYAHGDEVGTSYDMKIALSRAVNAVDDIIAELAQYDFHLIWCPIGNDFFHYDNVRQNTTMGSHSLDCDSRFPQMIENGVDIKAYMLERLAELAPVDGFWVPGNHDHMTSYQLCSALRQRYRLTDRITIDLGPRIRKIRRFGRTAVMFDHGQGVPISRWPTVFHDEVLRHAKDNKLTTDLTYKEVQLGHTHQRREKVVPAVTPVGDLQVVTNPSLCNADYWHFSNGFTGEPVKAIEARRYTETGLVGTHVAYTRDDHREIE